MIFFKSQNMALNSGVTPEGHEIGRAQLLQALAAGVVPSWLHNPILLKPTGEATSQVVVAGKVAGQADASTYFGLRDKLRPVVWRAFSELARRADVVLIEGAGSPAEINLARDDLVNMGLADLVDAPVLVAGDIDRGGVFAALAGTQLLLEPAQRARIQGWIINKFRGDPALLKDGLAMIEQRTLVGVRGVVPFVHDLGLDEEDGVWLERDLVRGTGEITVAALRLDRVSNSTDMDALAREPDVALHWTRDPDRVATADLVVIPGSKSTRADLADLERDGLVAAVQAAHARGAFVLGLCGGYQMLGREINDDEGVDGPPGRSRGLGLLPLVTAFARELPKVLVNTYGSDLATGERVAGYEIHQGRTVVDPLTPPLLELRGRPDGCTSADGRVMGCYLHGLLDAPGYRRALLNRVRAARGLAALAPSSQLTQSERLDRLADVLEHALDVPWIESLLERRSPLPAHPELDRIAGGPGGVDAIVRELFAPAATSAPPLARRAAVVLGVRDSPADSFPSGAFDPADRDVVRRVILARRDVRQFQSDPIPTAVLREILSLAHHAPSVGFMQPWNFVVVTSRGTRERVKDSFVRTNVAELAKIDDERRAALYAGLKLEGILESPLNVAVTCDRRRDAPFVLGRAPMPDTDLYSTCLAVENLMLAARAHGVGVGWVSLLDPALVARVLALPEGVVLVAYLCVGYPVEFRARPLLEEVGWKARAPLEGAVYAEQWGCVYDWGSGPPDARGA